MPPTKDHAGLLQSDFMGSYARGVSDTTPDRYFIDSLNVKFAEGDVLTRHGSVLKLSRANIRRFWTYKRLGETPRSILLDTSGNLVDSLAPGTPIWTDAAITDFSMVNYSNRAYITPHDRNKGLSGKSLIVYEGSGNARLAGGAAPSGFTLGVANSATAGSVEAGYHLIAVAGITSSGFITAPGPAVFALISAPGSKKLDISNIPVLAGAYWAGRVLLATKSIPLSLYNNNQFGYELFFIPGGTINDNTTTTKTVDFFDSDLQSSADYLLDNLATIPAGVGITVYQGRLISWGESGNQFTIRVSGKAQPEVFSAVDGFVNLDPSDAGSGIKNCAEVRGQNLLIATSNRLYGTADNGQSPSTWSVNILDKSVGVECFGIANVLDARGTNTDRIWMATRAGAMLYDGVARRPELSYYIEDLWKRINKAVFNLVQMVDDPTNHRIYVSVPLDAATDISHILIGDYSKAFTVYETIDERMIKWALWSFPSAPKSMVGDVDDVTGVPVLRISQTAGLYDVKDGLTDDYGNAIDSYVQLALKTASAGWINHFGGIKLRVKGSGSLQITVQGEDNSNPVTALPLTLAASPGKELDRLINYVNEKCSIKLRTNQFGEYFILSEFTLFAKALWLRRLG